MLQGISLIGFFDSIEDRRYNNADILDYMVVFENITLPSFVILVPTHAGQWRIRLIRQSDGAAITTDNSIQATEYGAVTVLKYSQTTIAVGSGEYYLELYVFEDENIKYYSEVYCCSVDTSDLIELSVRSNDVTLNGTYKMPLFNVPFDFFLKYNGHSISSEVNEEGVEKYFGDIPVFSAVNILHTVEINGTTQIYKFLAYCRALLVNGSISITKNGYVNEVYDISVDAEKTVATDDVMIINLSYREFDFIASRNEI